MSNVVKTNRPHSTPPTNVQLSTDYSGVDRGLFLTRDSTPKYLRVITAQWVSYGPVGSPGILKFKIGMYNSKPKTPAEYGNYTLLKARNNDEWFDVATSGPIHSPVLAEYWAQFIYYNYYILQSDIDSVYDHPPLVNDIIAVGTNLTKAIVPAINSIVNTAIFNSTSTKPLELTSFISRATPTVGTEKIIDFTSDIDPTSRFEPVLEASRKM